MFLCFSKYILTSFLSFVLMSCLHCWILASKFHWSLWKVYEKRWIILQLKRWVQWFSCFCQLIGNGFLYAMNASCWGLGTVEATITTEKFSEASMFYRFTSRGAQILCFPVSGARASSGIFYDFKMIKYSNSFSDNYFLYKCHPHSFLFLESLLLSFVLIFI